MINDYREARFPIRLPLETDESGQGYLLRLITYALSTAAGSPFVAPSASPSSRPSLERAQAALNAANELATQLQEEQAARMYIGSSKKSFELIASCLTHDFSAADRGFAQSLLAMLIKQYKTQRWSSTKPQLSQLLLF